MENHQPNEQHTHTISVLVENKFGVLSRVAGLFSGRGYNIHSLNVAPCEDPRFSRMSIDVNEHGDKLDQVIKQLSKLVNVVEVTDFRNYPTVYREIVLLRVRFADKKGEILELCQIFGAKVLDATRETMTIEISGGEFRLARFLDLMSDYDVEMVTRSGKIAVVKKKG
ncbi:MAG: acetolactate synthase small subunit [Akkermansia sp.]|nr:acetolactate synthase small subunit [Akkermansia sp.]